jgi:AbiV family abortive infection protein
MLDKADVAVLWRGLELSSENAKDVLSLARYAAKAKKFGSAASLAVLACEEAAKALGLATRALNASPENLKLRKYFSDHKHKHGAGAAMLAGAEVVHAFVTEISAVAADPTVPDDKKSSVLVERLVRRADEELSGKRTTFETLRKWYEQADSVKKRGFYVDWSGRKWLTPRDVTEEAYRSQDMRAQVLVALSEIVVGLGYEQARSQYLQATPSKNPA